MCLTDNHCFVCNFLFYSERGIFTVEAGQGDFCDDRPAGVVSFSSAWRIRVALSLTDLFIASLPQFAMNRFLLLTVLPAKGGNWCLFSFANIVNVCVITCQVTMTDRGSAERACKDPNPIIDGRKSNVNLAYIGAKPRNMQLGEPTRGENNRRTHQHHNYTCHVHTPYRNV